MGVILGFNKGTSYEAYTRINITMNQSSNLEDIKQLVSESYSGKYDVSYTDDFKDTVSIRVKNMSEEELNTLKQKLTDKYGFEEGANNIVETDVPSYSTIDLAKPYIMPIVISFIAVLIYYAITFRKLGIVNALLKPIVIVIMTIAVYASIFAICRIPISEYVMPLGVVIYVITLLYISIHLNNEKKA